jgi:hypothetical protein
MDYSAWMQGAVSEDEDELYVPVVIGSLARSLKQNRSSVARLSIDHLYVAHDISSCILDH